jgi:hypothetical protein
VGAAPTGPSCLTRVAGQACGAPDRCDDRDQPAAPFVELGGPVNAWLADDSTPLLQEVNLDVRPRLSDVEGIVGTELLAHLRLRIDYPNSRMIVRCALGDTRCQVHQRYVCPSQVSDCGPRGDQADAVCSPPSSIPAVCQ